MTLAVLRFSQGSLLLFLYLAWRKPAALRVRAADVPFLAILGVDFFTVFPVAFNTSLRHIAASRGALLLASMPLWSLVFGRLIARERLSTRESLGVVLSVCGVAIVFARRALSPGVEASRLGDILMIVTAICGALYGVFSRRMLAKYEGVTVTFYAMLIGTLALVPFAAAERGLGAIAAASTTTRLLVAFVGVLGGGVAFALWTTALRTLSPTRVAVYLNLNPLVATVLAATLLHERLTNVFILGFATVIAGVALVNAAPRLAALSEASREAPSQA